MRTSEFRDWLRHVHLGKQGSALGDATIAARTANCETVDRCEGDLDRHAATDGMVELLSRLTYSTADQERGIQPRHRVPIAGDLRTGSATLKSAVKLYQQFCSMWPAGAPRPAFPEAPRPSVTRKLKSSAPSGTWPTWPQPTDSEVLSLARVVMPYVRFLSPEIVAAIADDNERHRQGWSDAFKGCGINPEAYLWNRSPCAFPGVRRYAGSREVAMYRGHLKDETTKIDQALRLDDNDCPKHVWSFTLRGKEFQKHGPTGYSLAHLADHKSHGNRFELDFELVDGANRTELFGLYSCPTNAAFIPTAMIKPTDFDGPMRNLLLRRAQALYGGHCRIVPEWLQVRSSHSDDWHLDEFSWAEPVGDAIGVAAFLDYRNNMLQKLLDRPRA